ncbi:MAG: hypothetical protein IPJ88_05680 [Myxococcales bacterium]|nr:MAG: hypothetical protein IPJ88_05680 [Myxococcales bacterium]
MSFLKVLGSQMGLRVPGVGAVKRRKTSPAPRQAKVLSRPMYMARGAALAIPKTWLYAGSAMLLGALLMWAFGHSKQTEVVKQVDKERVSSVEAEDNSPVAEEVFEEEVFADGAESANEELEARANTGVDPLLESALPAPSYEAGPVSPTRYPTLQQSAKSTSRPQASDSRPSVVERAPKARVVAKAEPVQATASSSGPSFGAGSVRGARSYTLRMSQTVKDLQGSKAPDGFRVRIPGSLSLDKAGPIAEANPQVARAMILNHGDYAELSVFFEAGQHPGYRVVAKGSSLEVSIGR